MSTVVRLILTIGIVVPFALFAAISPQSALSQDDAVSRLELKQGDRIAIIGNTLAERMQYYGHFETLLQSRFPKHELVVRNLGWSAEQLGFGWAEGDEQKLFRSKDFADHGHRLKDVKASVIIACFGFNESFGGEEKLAQFREQLQSAIQYWKETKFDGKAPPRVVLVTPIPIEKLARLKQDNIADMQQRVALYAKCIQQEAAAAKVVCVDAYQALQLSMAKLDSDLTFNGIHLNETGDRVFAEALDQSLFGDRRIDWRELNRLKAAVQEKAKQFFYDYRSVNGYYVYGGRKAPFGVVNFPVEFAKLRKMIANRDRRIWDIAQGKQVPDVIDDSQTGEFLEIQTNVPRETRCLTPEEELATFHLPKGYVAELFASEREFPELAKPCQIAVDAKGRIWTCTMPSYPHYLPGQPVNDQILILEDTTGDGKADRCTPFASGLYLPTGFEIGDHGAYVAQQPNLVHYIDDDGDDRADRSEIVLHGFDSADSHHSISAFTWGPGGDLYFQEGTFHHSQVETADGPVRLKDAGVFRYEPKTEKLDVFVSYPFANPWGHCFDFWGQDFVADASTGNNYFAAAFSGQVIFPQKHRAMQTFLVKQWRPTAGCTFVSSPNFPAETQGDFLITNCIGFQGVLQYRMKEEGSGFKAEPVEPLLSSTDPACRPVDVRFGLDGALYVCDWYNPLIGHMQHNLRDPKRDNAHGRIWRIRREDQPLHAPPRAKGTTAQELVELLDSQEDQVRYVTRRELRELPTQDVIAALKTWVARSDDSNRSHRQLESLWVQQHHQAVDEKLLNQVLQSEEPRARAAAVRALCYLRDSVTNVNDWLIRAAEDPHPRVRLEAVRAASFLSGADGDRVVQAALKHPLDYYLQYTINETSDTLELRGGRPGGAASAAVERLASGKLDQDQVLPLIQLSTSSASVADFSRLLSAVVESESYNQETKVAVIELLKKESTARKLTPIVRPDLLLNYARTALKKDQPILASQLISLIEAWQIPGMIVELQRIAIGRDVPAEVAQAALSALASDGSPGAWDLIREMTSGSDDPQIRLSAAVAIAKRDVKRAVNLTISALQSGRADFEGVRRATEAILRQQAGAKEFAVGIREGKLKQDPARVLLRSVYAVGNSDEQLANELAQAAGLNLKAKTLSAEEKSALVRNIQESGSAVAGELVYRRSELNCIRCHAISGAGGKVGPDLSAVGSTSPVDYLIDSLLHPSQQIKEAFLTRKILTSSGQVLTGIRIDSNDQRVVIRDAEGREITIPVADIDEELEGPSLMPEGLTNLLTHQELLDLIKFLSELGKPGRYAVNQRGTIQKYALLKDATVLRQLAKAEEGKLEAMLDEVVPGAWLTQFALVDGQIPSSDLVAPEKLPVILRAEVNLSVAGAIAVNVAPAEKVQVVIRGQTVAANGKQAIDLKEGTTAIFLVYERGIPDSTVSIQVTKPDSAKTQFTIVGGQ